MEAIFKITIYSGSKVKQLDNLCLSVKSYMFDHMEINFKSMKILLTYFV